MARPRAAKAAPPAPPARAPARPAPALNQSIGTPGLPSRQPSEFAPPETPATPDDAVMTFGMPLRYNRAASLFMDDPLFIELRGPRADRTIQRMLADPIISGATERTSLYLRAADWSVKPGGEAPADVAFAEFVNENLEGLTTGWRSTIANMADAIAWGFSLFEILFEFDGNALRWADFSPREQRTVRSWYVEPGTARLKHVVQLTDRGLSVPIPAWKLIHFRTHPASGRPEGRSLVRNAFLPWSDKQELRRIMKLGLRRDFTGVAMQEVPARILSAAATPVEKASLAAAEALVRDFERDEREGIVVPSATNADGTSSGWKFSLIQSAGRRQIDFDAMKAALDRDILVALLSEYILMGHESVGSFALASVKANLFGRAITSWLDMIAEIMVKKVVPVLQAFNPQFAAAAMPLFVHGDIDEIPIDVLGTFLQAVSAGGYVTPDPAIEEALRRRADLPLVRAEQEL